MRDNFAARLYHQRTGYWKADGHGLAPVPAAASAAALDLSIRVCGEIENKFQNWQCDMSS